MTSSGTGSRRLVAAWVALAATLLTLSTAWGAQGEVLQLEVYSPSLEGNLLSDSPTRSVTLYLPPGYGDDTSRRYPVLYLLHGWKGTDRVWMGEGVYGADFRVSEITDRLIADGTVPPVILAMPDAANSYFGSFYVNSSATGAWEDFIIRDLVPYVDANYRTLDQPESRGIAGHSMGGFGAFCLAMKHPDVFGSLYAMSPVLLGLVDRESSVAYRTDAWTEALGLTSYSQYASAGVVAQLQIATASALSPNPESAPFYVDLPCALIDGQPVPREDIWALWSTRTPMGMLDDLAHGMSTLRGIAFDCGTSDMFSHISVDSRAMSDALTDHGIDHTFVEFTGGHNDRVAERFEEVVLPYFGELLDSSRVPTAVNIATWGNIKRDQ